MQSRPTNPLLLPGQNNTLREKDEWTVSTPPSSFVLPYMDKTGRGKRKRNSLTVLTSSKVSTCTNVFWSMTSSVDAESLRLISDRKSAAHLLTVKNISQVAEQRGEVFLRMLGCLLETAASPPHMCSLQWKWLEKSAESVHRRLRRHRVLVLSSGSASPPQPSSVVL